MHRTIRNSFALTAALTISALALTMSAAQAELVIGNLPVNDGDSTVISGTGSALTTSKAAGFTMGITSFQLTGVELRLNVNSGAIPLLRLFDSNGGGLPNTSLFTFTNPTFTENVTDTYSFTQPSPFILNASTRYWLVLTNTAPGTTFRWLRNIPDTPPTGSYATNAGYRFGNGANFLTTTSTFFNGYAVNGVALVPEAGTVTLLGIGGTLLGAIIIRRRKSN